MGAPCVCPTDRHTLDCWWFDPYIDGTDEYWNVPEHGYDDRFLDDVLDTTTGEPMQLTPDTVRQLALEALAPPTSQTPASGLNRLTSSSGRLSSWGDSWSYPSCTHQLQPYILTDGTAVYASSSMNSHYGNRPEEPDLAVYLDSSWIPECIAYHIGWKDFGLPYVPSTQVLTIARRALEAARNGETVEIGCLGGHGRTGTFLAILDLLSTEHSSKPLSGKRAIRNVRQAYCQRAVEGRIQEWYVKLCAARIFGNPDPPRPRLPKPKKQATKPGPLPASTHTPSVKFSTAPTNKGPVYTGQTASSIADSLTPKPDSELLQLNEQYRKLEEQASARQSVEDYLNWLRDETSKINNTPMTIQEAASIAYKQIEEIHGVSTCVVKDPTSGHYKVKILSTVDSLLAEPINRP